MAPRPKPLPLLPRHPAAATRSFIDLRTSSASTRCFLSGCNVTPALNTLPELWRGGTLNLPGRRRPGQGVKLHPSWWVSHHHAVQGLFTMTGRHRVVRRLSTVYWGTTLNCILPTPSTVYWGTTLNCILPDHQTQAISCRHRIDRAGRPLIVPSYQAPVSDQQAQATRPPGSGHQATRHCISATSIRPAGSGHQTTRLRSYSS